MRKPRVPTHTRTRVLCVDDDEDSRVMLATLLRLSFIEVKAVETAAQALSLIQTEHFDLCMLDAKLPDVDGFELCRRMRTFDSRIPILFFSGAAYEADKKKGFEAGADDYVIKPNISELVRSVKQLTSRDVQQPVTPVPHWTEVRPVVPANKTSTLGQVGIPPSLAKLPIASRPISLAARK